MFVTIPLIDFPIDDCVLAVPLLIPAGDHSLPAYADIPTFLLFITLNCLSIKLPNQPVRFVHSVISLNCLLIMLSNQPVRFVQLTPFLYLFALHLPALPHISPYGLSIISAPLNLSALNSSTRPADTLT